MSQLRRCRKNNIINELKKYVKDEYYLPKGITLVALVVTIIVLLILAGVAISLTIGNNGLFTRAENAVNTWKKAEINEQREMQNFTDLYDETVSKIGLNNSGGNTKKSVEDITGEETTNTEVVDKNGDKVVIPAGFIVDQNNNTVVNGLVIIDKRAGSTETKGNEFVWIPCTIDGANNTLQYDRYAFTKDDWSNRQTKLNDKDLDGSYKIVCAEQLSYYYHEHMPEQESKSIEKYGGFYIGRYEVGCDLERTEESKGNTSAIAKIQSGLKVYNYITKTEANKISEKMYTGKSRLCSSYAWDTALKFIDGKNGNYSVNNEGGNYSGSIKNTGYFAKKNIYDMGGNVWEWTSELYSDGNLPSVCRRIWIQYLLSCSRKRMLL